MATRIRVTSGIQSSQNALRGLGERVAVAGQGASAISVRPVIRVWMQTAFLAAVALVVYLVALRDLPPPDHAWIPWPVLAAASAIAELKVVEVHFRRETSHGRRRNPLVLAMKATFRAGYLRIGLALMTLASFAYVLEAGQRWR